MVKAPPKIFGEEMQRTRVPFFGDGGENGGSFEGENGGLHQTKNILKLNHLRYDVCTAVPNTDPITKAGTWFHIIVSRHEVSRVTLIKVRTLDVVNSHNVPAGKLSRI